MKGSPRLNLLVEKCTCSDRFGDLASESIWPGPRIGRGRAWLFFYSGVCSKLPGRKSFVSHSHSASVEMSENLFWRLVAPAMVKTFSSTVNRVRTLVAGGEILFLRSSSILAGTRFHCQGGRSELGSTEDLTLVSRNLPWPLFVSRINLGIK